jgi:hypothetical protein
VDCAAQQRGDNSCSPSLPRPQVTDVGVTQLKSLKKLQVLSLAGTLVSKAGVAKLRQLLPGGVRISHKAP